MILNGQVNGKNWTLDLNKIPTWARELPLWSGINGIVNVLVNYRISVIVAETASGKSLMIPWIIGQLQDQGLLKKVHIYHGQPLVDTARSMRGDLQEILGKSVDLRTGPHKEEVGGVMTIGTAGSLLYRANGSLLSIVDEAHEQHIDTLFWVGRLKLAFDGDRERKIVVLSATLSDEDVRAWQLMFGQENVGLVRIPGRQYKLNKHEWDLGDGTFEEQMPTLIESIALEAAPKLMGANNMLVFVPSPKYFVELVVKLKKQLGPLSSRYEILVYSGTDRGRKVNLPAGWREAVGWSKVSEPNMEDYIKYGGSHLQPTIIFCTDVIRTGISVLGVQVSVSSGWQVRRYYNPVAGYGGTKEELTSKMSVLQELGRAARFMDGWGFAVKANNRPERETPSIQTQAMAQTVLRLIQMNHDPESFPFLHPPKEGAIAEALVALEEIGAVERVETLVKWKLTSVGKAMSYINAEPHLSRMVIEAHRRGCLPEMIVAVAAVAARELFWNPRNAAKWDEWKDDPYAEMKINRMQNGVRRSSSDYLTALNIWIEWSKADQTTAWANEHGLYPKGLRQLRSDIERMVEALDGVSYIYNGDEVSQTIRVTMSDLKELTIPERERRLMMDVAILSGTPRNVFISQEIPSYIYELAGDDNDSYRDFYIFPGSSVFSHTPKLLTARFEARRGEDPVDPVRFWLKAVHEITVESLKLLAPERLEVDESEPTAGILGNQVWKVRTISFDGKEIAREEVLVEGEEAARALQLRDERRRLPWDYSSSRRW